MKLWIKDAPIYGVNSNQEVMEFITKHITCSIPNDINDDELKNLVLKFQQHSCNKSCKRLKKIKNNYSTICRYGFPRNVCDKVSLNSLEKTVKSRNGKQ